MSATKHRFVISGAARVREVCRMVFQVASQLAASSAVEVVVSPAKSKRTLDQNALMWSILGEISRQVPWVVDGAQQMLHPDEWKDLFTAALRQEMRVAQGISGGVVLLGRRTSRMTIAEMSDLIELMSAFCAERGVRIPERRFIEYWEQAA